MNKLYNQDIKDALRIISDKKTSVKEMREEAIEAHDHLFTLVSQMENEILLSDQNKDIENKEESAFHISMTKLLKLSDDLWAELERLDKIKSELIKNYDAGINIDNMDNLIAEVNKGVK